jgi:hypothetical protein
MADHQRCGYFANPKRVGDEGIEYRRRPADIYGQDKVSMRDDNDGYEDRQRLHDRRVAPDSAEPAG